MAVRTARHGLIGLAALALVAPMVCAQGVAVEAIAPADVVPEVADAAPLVAMVLEVEGRAEVRIDAPSSAASATASVVGLWQPIERGMQLPTGATIRTGARSGVTLRLGLNATVRVNSFARAQVSELARQTAGDAATLRTTLLLERGDLDVRVDHVGDAANDFAIVTQAATLAVRGTNFSVGVDGLDGLRIQGAQTNSFRAIEVKYVEEEEATALSRGRLDDSWRNPALAALAMAVDAPNHGVSAREYLSRLGTPIAQLVSGRQRPGDQLAVVRSIEIRDATAGQVRDGIGSGKDGPPPQGDVIDVR